MSFLEPIREPDSDYVPSLRNLHQGRPFALITMVMGLGCFTLGFFLLDKLGKFSTSQPFHLWLAAAFLTMFGMFGMFIGARRWTPVRWRCPHCKQILSSLEPWRCGLCQHENRTKSMLACCANSACHIEPDAYECQHCQGVTLLTKAKNGAKPARSVNALPVDPQAPKAALRASRTDELEHRAHEQHILELERNKLSLEIDVARLKRDLNRPEPKVVDLHQARVNAMADKMNSVAANCRTMQDAIAQLRALHAELDRTEPDEKVRQQLKDAFSMQFEEIFRALGAEIRV